MTWTSQIAKFNESLTTAIQDGVDAAAGHYEDSIKAALSTGYVSGKFVTGEAADSVFVAPLTEKDYAVSIGTNLMLALYWELGHYNVFTHLFERREKWRPVFEEELETMKEKIVSSLEGIEV